MADSIERIAAEIIRQVQHGATEDWRLNMIEVAARLRALSPAGGDWVATKGDRALGKNRGASPQQEPGADGCGACGDSCANRGACRLADDSPTRLYALAAAIRGEADIADRPGQMARLNAIADELSVHSKPTPVDESWATINVNEIDSKSIADPSGQTLAGAGGEFDDWFKSYGEHEQLNLARAADGRLLSPTSATAENAYLSACMTSAIHYMELCRNEATSAGTTGDDSEDAARYRWLRDEPDGFEDGHGVFRSRGICPTGAILWGHNLDVAIDAARRARGEG